MNRKKFLFVLLCMICVLPQLRADEYDHVNYLLGVADSLAQNEDYAGALDSLIVAGEELVAIDGNVGVDYTDYISYPSAIYLYHMNRIDEASTLLYNTISIRQQYYPYDCTLAEMYMYYSLLCQENGNYYEAYIAAQNGIKIARRQENCDQPLIGSLNGVAQACIEMGDYEEAVQYTKEIINLFPTDTNIVLTAMNNLASDYIMLKDYDKSIQIANEAIKLANEDYGLLFQLALAYSCKEEYRTAINYGLRSLAIKEKLSSPSESVTKSYMNLGFDYEDYGMPDSALYYYDKAMDLILGRDSFILIKRVPEYLCLEMNRILLLRELGYNKRLEKSISDFDNTVHKWLPHYKDRLLDSWQDMNGNRMLQMKESVRTNCLRIINQNKLSRSRVANGNGYDACLLYFGSALNMLAERMKAIRKLDNDTLYYLYNTQLYLERELDKHQYRYSNEQLDTIKSYINYCTNNMRALLDSVDIAADLRIGWEDVQQVLDSNEIAIEFFRYSTDSMDEYHAYILRNTWNSPKCVILSSSDRLGISEDYRHHLWQTIIDSASVKQGEKIYFSPSGEMYNLPIETTFLADTLCYNEVYEIVRVSSTRVLCHKNKQKANNNRACVYGGLTYTESANQFVKNSHKTRSVSPQFLLFNQDTSVTSRDLDRAQYTYLPYTQKEASAVQDMLKRAKYKVKSYCRELGTEESFYSMSGASPSIIHISTHGFYIDSLDSNAILQRNRSTSPESSKKSKLKILDSMDRTGLLLSGALTQNKEISDEVADGILSATEIGYLDLSQTDLVVLSCCNTGLGDITNDGVAGLQRGFKIAGVNSIMMSLWPVDDAATYLLMTEFYKNYLGGKTKTESLRDAQRYLRNYEQDGEKIFADPKYWAAFVLLDALD